MICRLEHFGGRFMKRFGAVLALYVVAVTLPARAASPRTFVSFAGVDSNPCSRPAPCRSFSAALAQTMAGGVIVVLDSAGYGPAPGSMSSPRRTHFSRGHSSTIVAWWAVGTHTISTVRR